MVQNLVNFHLQGILLVILVSFSYQLNIVRNKKSVGTGLVWPKLPGSGLQVWVANCFDVTFRIRLSARTEGLLNELIPFSTKDIIKLLKTERSRTSILPISTNPESNGLNKFNPSSLATNSFGHFKIFKIVLEKVRRSVHKYFVRFLSGHSWSKFSCYFVIIYYND